GFGSGFEVPGLGLGPGSGRYYLEADIDRAKRPHGYDLGRNTGRTRSIVAVRLDRHQEPANVVLASRVIPPFRRRVPHPGGAVHDVSVTANDTPRSGRLMKPG